MTINCAASEASFLKMLAKGSGDKGPKGTYRPCLVAPIANFTKVRMKASSEEQWHCPFQMMKQGGGLSSSYNSFNQ
jgi:hypothetical protein